MFSFDISRRKKREHDGSFPKTYLFIYFFLYNNIILNIYEEYHQFELEFKSASSKSSHVRPFSSAALYLALYSISIKYKVSKCDGS